MNILFLDACVRAQSRTRLLAQEYLCAHSGDTVTTVSLQEEQLLPLDRERLAQRDALLAAGKLDAPMFRLARQFAEADRIVIAAPFWDLGFPALLKLYFEQIMVTGITFHYRDGVPHGLCRADKLVYCTTAGGPIFADFGYSYAETIAKSFFGIPETVCIRAENLDVIGADTEAILQRAREEVRALQ
ncbi:MAG: NAD(P)H-dependent oxidoreductase [Oscillospiraceae bacterium]|nr:NAD(P)H-dependent oxidoreductase [Oscillospiraceae bacterium]